MIVRFRCFLKIAFLSKSVATRTHFFENGKEAVMCGTIFFRSRKRGTMRSWRENNVLTFSSRHAIFSVGCAKRIRWRHELLLRDANNIMTTSRPIWTRHDDQLFLLKGTARIHITVHDAGRCCNRQKVSNWVWNNFSSGRNTNWTKLSLVPLI